MEDTQMADDNPNLALETPAEDVFMPPSINEPAIVAGDSYIHFSPVPDSLLPPKTPTEATTEATDAKEDTQLGPPCFLGVDEAGRGPVLGPMVYGVFYLPAPLSDPLLRETHHFDDSKVLKPEVRSALMEALCSAGSDLYSSCGWAVSALSARDIGANMMRPASAAAYNLNAQAFDATVALIRGVMDRGVNVAEIYVDTVGPPATYQKRLERVFPTARVTVAKKADSLYPCVSAASVCAKVTRDAALEVLYKTVLRPPAAAPGGEEAEQDDEEGNEQASWGSGYPSDARCVTWMRRNMHPVFGWGPECRFSWGTAKEMLEPTGTAKVASVKVDWPLDDDGENGRMTDFLVAGGRDKDADELGTWFGTPADVEAF
ncbi:ribonuclease H2 subunit A [Gaeumannomyces tritici R3-111a-1]|uniref:Ribonuclease n=1 Tax=Gaeumannomyces tritici (strain R3-111a-1) TaxID=644352 RepID=J3PB53_GAET3|nr:ribonuclease H2 subunit A [Gaeumannomyces tritici R3-111a-1]EJT71469.1 ribonuclease H2 subunit A [Gaeumannomyces tritici R3-111a-1]